ncbi:MAG TPA: protein translocase subunit SecF [Actinomycetota bacterium]|nr:protein translocase subunit SecF [Actinomycetota bacterium]
MSVRSAVATFRGHHIPNVDFLGRKRWWFMLSGFFIVLSLVGLFGRGLNYSIDFKGGALLQFPNKSHASVAEYSGVMSQFGRGDAEVEIFGNGQVNIRTRSLTDLKLQADDLRAALAKEAGISGNQINETDVGPTWGSTISSKAITGLIVFLVLVSLYISMRFEPKMAGGALVALVHDLIITAGIYALVGREVTPETVIAVLTILGYSLYDTVVIFDKVKENTESPALVARETYSGVANLSLNQTFMRSVNTSLVVLLPIGALLLFGGQTLKDFAFALFIGVATGAYSSIFVATPVLAVLKEREPRYQSIRTRQQVRGTKAAREAGETERAVRELAPAGVAASGGADRPRPSSSRPRPSGSGSSRRKKGRPQGKAKRRRR